MITPPVLTPAAARPRPVAPPVRDRWRFHGTLLAFMLLVLHLAVEHHNYVWWHRALGAFPGMLAIYLGGGYLVRRQFHRLPFIEYALVHWYLFLGLPTVTSGDPRIPISHDAFGEAVIGVTLMVGTAFAAYYLGRWFGHRFRRPTSALLPDLPSDTVNVIFWPWLLFTAVLNSGVTAQLPDSLRYPSTIVGSYYPLLALEALRVYGDKKASPRRFLIATAVLCAAGMFSGSMSLVLTPLLTLGVLHTLLKGRIPKRAVLLFFALIIVLQPAKLIYRELTWHEKGVSSGSVGEKIDHWIEAFSQAWFGGGRRGSSEDELDTNVDMLAHRFDALSSTAACFELVPEIVPYDRGAMWKFLFIAPIPRAIYPDKPNPTSIYNNRYNVTFGLQTEEAVQKATFVFPLVSDGYWNFGWWGVALVGFIVGFLLGVYTGALQVWRWGSLSLALALFVDARFHGHLALHTAGLLQTVIGTAIVCWTIWLATYSSPRRSRVR